IDKNPDLDDKWLTSVLNGARGRSPDILVQADTAATYARNVNLTLQPAEAELLRAARAGDKPVRKLLRQRWLTEAEHLQAERTRHWFDVLTGHDVYGPPTEREAQLRRDIRRLADPDHWAVNERGEFTPIGTMAAGLPPQFLDLEAALQPQQPEGFG